MCAYPRRSGEVSVIADNLNREVKLTRQKSAEAIVPGDREGLNIKQRLNFEAFDEISITAENFIIIR
jgi:hypothetical protein